MSWLGAFCKGGLYCLSVYFWTSEGLSQRNLDILHAIAQIIKQLHGPWLLAADFNFTPEEIVSSGWLQLVGGQIHAPSLPTCNRSIYVYFVLEQ